MGAPEQPRLPGTGDEPQAPSQAVPAAPSDGASQDGAQPADDAAPVRAPEPDLGAGDDLNAPDAEAQDAEPQGAVDPGEPAEAEAPARAGTEEPERPSDEPDPAADPEPDPEPRGGREEDAGAPAALDVPEPDTDEIPLAAARAVEPAVEPAGTVDPPDHDDADEPAVVTEPVAAEPDAEEPVADEPVVAEPVAEEPVVAEPVAEEPVVAEPVADEPVVAEPVADEPVVAEPVADEPTVDEPTVDEPTVDEPTVDEPTVDEPAAAGPAAGDPAQEPAAGPVAARVPAPPLHRPRERARTRLLEAMKPKLNRGQMLAALLCAGLGFGLVTQIQSTQSEQLDALTQADLVRLLQEVNTEADRLAEQEATARDAREKLAANETGDREAEALTSKRLQALGVLAGTLPATGPGIRLTLTDPKGEVDAATLLDTLQEVRDAGAEAVQINDVRVVASTAFEDLDGGVRIGGEAVRPPYTYLVIGDAETLDAAMRIPGGVLDVVEQKGGKGIVTRLDRVDVTALHRVVDPQYARPAPEASP